MNREKLNELAAENRDFDISKAKDRLNLMPRHNLKEGLEETIE